ncbi:ROK family protein [Cellulomonas biazotea]|uniref:NagC family transcriptional regulator n=1 Tax=Cellulomonas biazotea TaxID=1709 RepID=A0A402DPG5_9CELL|nr:ROK family protein [Cellulomonas biazotea]GCE76020.1 NagC family transcriptional regulator [Cellulomonas biazotea]
MDTRGNGTGGWSVGLDIGGSKVLGVALDPSGAVRHEVRASTVRGLDGVVSGAVAAVERLADLAGVAVGDLSGVGLGLPGVVDVAAGTVEHAVNLGIEARVGLAALVAERVGAVPVRLENDLNAAVVGAAQFVAPHDADGGRDLAFLALGTGLAAGLLLDGRLRRGSQGAAGEIGHLTFVPDGLPCKCGQAGCLEQYASGSALDAAWPSRTGAPAPAEVFAAAAAGDPRAVDLRDQFATAVAAAVRVLVLTCDVRHVVVGGGVSAVGEPLLDAVRGVLDRAARTSAFLESMRLAERVTLAPSGVPVGAVGAALVGRGDVTA